MQRRLSFFQRIATAVSGLDPRRNGTSDPEGLGRGLARSSQKPGSVRRSIQIVAALSTMTAASCLITTDPEFEPPAKTPPFFLPDTASPSADEVIQIASGDQLTFSALFQAEDAGSPILGQLYLDYGSVTSSGRVYVSSIDLDVTVPSGSWADGPRRVSATYNENEAPMSVGCHRLTLMVVHGSFLSNGCPAEDGDYDTQTWLVQKCADENCKDSLGGKELFDASKCPPVPADLSTKCPRSELSPANVGGSP